MAIENITTNETKDDEKALLYDISELLYKSKMTAHVLWLASNGLRDGFDDNDDSVSLCRLVLDLEAAISDASMKLETARSILQQKRSGEAA